MNEPRLIKLTEIAPYIDNVRVCMHCKFCGMQEYQKYYGADASSLPLNILNSLCIEKIWVSLDTFSDGILATLNISASDTVSMITFNPSGIFEKMMGDQPDQKPEPTEDDEAQEV